jgi:acetyl esterase/lipase
MNKLLLTVAAALLLLVMRLAQAASEPTSVLSAAPAASPSQAAPVPLERFFEHPAFLKADLSPSGRYVALISVRDDSKASLLVVDLDSNAPAQVAAIDKKRDVVDFHWVGDERLIYSLGELEPGRVHRHAPGLYGVNPDGSQGIQLICSEVAVCRKQTELLDYYYALVHVPQPQPGVRPDEVIVNQFNRPQWLDTRHFTMRDVDMPEPPKKTAQWWFNSRGEPRLTLTVDEDRRAFHWLAPGAKAWQRIAEFDFMHPPFWPQGVGDDGKLYVTQQRGASGESVLTTFDFTTGAPAQRALVEVPGFDFAGSLVQGPPGSGPLGVHVEADSGSTVWFNDTLTNLQSQLDKRWPTHVNHLTCRRCGQPDMVVLVNSWSDHDPGRLLLYRAATKRLESVAVARPAVDPQRMATLELQRIRARDGRDLPVWITRPAGLPEGQAAPAVVLVHGGPWARGRYWQWEPMSQFLASRGYLVIEPEFRGSSGYGEAHERAGYRQWGLAMQDDVADALLWARKQGLANERACIAGASYGGYATLMGLVRHPDLYRCGVAWLGVADLPLYLKGGLWVDDDISSLARTHVLPELVGDADKDADMLNSVSPLAQAQHIKAPLLLAYGEKDRRVPVEHGERLRKALTELGRPPQWVEYRNEYHGWYHLSTRVDFARRVESFLQQHLKDTPP